MTGCSHRRILTAALICGLTIALPSRASADEVLDWNQVLITAIGKAGLPGPAGFRLMAIVQVAVYDAVNGIDRRYTPIHVSVKGPQHASRRAAAVQAAYTTLVALFPAQAADFDAALDASMSKLLAHASRHRRDDIARGRSWGEFVANEILAWRATDGFDFAPSTYVGSEAVGKWRPTPPGMATGLFPSLATTTPFVIPTPSSFRQAGPPALTSLEYAADVNEVKVIGEDKSTVRTADQTEAVNFWAATAPTFWNRTAAQASRRFHLGLVANARLLGMLNAAMADANIACWEAKYFYELWRPITAIQLADTDGNPATTAQTDWMPAIVTPPFPEYPSGHGETSGAAQMVLSLWFGRHQHVEGTSEGLPGVVRSWNSFSEAADEANDARIWGGIHFRSAIHDAREAGDAIGAYVFAHAAQPRHHHHH
jgi:hypothetical protein